MRISKFAYEVNVAISDSPFWIERSKLQEVITMTLFSSCEIFKPAPNFYLKSSIASLVKYACKKKYPSVTKKYGVDSLT